MAGYHSYVLVTVLALGLLTESESRLTPSLLSSLDKIKASMSVAKKDVQKRVQTLTDYFKSGKEDTDMQAIASSVEKIGGAVSSLTSSDISKIISGTMTVMSAVTSLIPVHGQIISVFFSLASSIFSAIGGQSDDVGSVVKREIEKALNKFQDSNLKAEAAGTIRVFRISHAYLSSKEGDHQITEKEIDTLAANVPVYQGVKFLGELGYKVEEVSKSTDKEQVKRAMEYTQLYTTLAVLRSAVLWEMYSLVRTVPGRDWTAAAYQRVAQREELHDKKFIEYLINPDYSRAVFFANFNPSEWPQIMVFIEKNGMKFQDIKHLVSGVHTLSPEKWPNYYMYMTSWTSDFKAQIGGTTTLDTAAQFTFEYISRQDNVFYLRSAKWPDWYVYMESQREGYCKGWKGQPGKQGEWKVVRFHDGKYMLSPLAYLDWFIYMESTHYGAVRGWQNDPGVQGHWSIN